MAVKNCTHGIVALASSSCGHTSPFNALVVEAFFLLSTSSLKCSIRFISGLAGGDGKI
jgi:hypothetical protein